MDAHQEDQVVINDKRRIDPTTGQLRENIATEKEENTATGTSRASTAAGLETEKVAELTEDLQRLQAEFANYKKRTDRDRLAVVENTKAVIVSDFLTILDDLEQAKVHGDLQTEPLRSISEKLFKTITNLGVNKFGTPGDSFDPNYHEAVQNEGNTSDLVISSVLRDGYKLGDKILRTAMVTVADAVAGAETETPVEEVVVEEITDS